MLGQLWGAQFAWSEISLVLFTTLTPSGIIASIALLLLYDKGGLSEKSNDRVERFLLIPLALSTIGLIASAAHLGTPGNALFVITGIGRSPLSNEVFANIVFLGLLGVYWYRSFSEKHSARIDRIWRIVTACAGVIALLSISLAYSVPTIPTWNDVLGPVLLWTTAFVGAPLICLVTLCAAKLPGGIYDQTVSFLLRTSVIASILSLVLFIVRWAVLAGVGNFTVTASDLVPLAPAGICLFAVLCAIAHAIIWHGQKREQGISTKRAVLSCIIALVALFIMRFCFYAVHLTVGLGI